MTETKPAIDKRRIARDRIVADRTIWRALVEDVGPDRMEVPGPMGDWTVSYTHLTLPTICSV